MKAYLLVQTENGREPVSTDLLAIPGIESAADLTGPFDAIAVAASETLQELMGRVVASVQRIPGVIRAISAPVINHPADGLVTPGATQAA